MIELSCSQLKKYYGAQLVLENITFEVQEGERVAVIGKNGCGKSTILKLITRVEAPDEGCEIGRASCRERVSMFV